MKNFWARKLSTGYALNTAASGRKKGDQAHRNLGQDIVLRLLEPYYGTGRDVSTNSIFTTFSLLKLLLESILTILGTIRTHRREIPSGFSNRMELYSPKFLYNHDDGVCLDALELYSPQFLYNYDDGVCLVAYQAKKKKSLLCT